MVKKEIENTARVEQREKNLINGPQTWDSMDS
jgi:hypothetical protein